MTPALPTLVWRHWQATWDVDLAAGLSLALYGIAVRRVRAPWPRRRSAAFAAGVAMVLVALQSGIGAYDDQLLSDHIVQHMLLLEAAPLLLLAGRPGLLALRAAPHPARRQLIRALHRLRGVTSPLACLAIFAAIVLGTHVPAFYDAAVRDPALHELEHGLDLAAGLLAWWPVLDADPLARHRLNGFARLAYVVAAMTPMTLIGAYLDRASTVVYTVYAAPARTLGVSAVADQQHAGAIMWVLGSTLLIVVGLWQAMAAMVEEERRLGVRERRLDDAVALRRGTER